MEEERRDVDQAVDAIEHAAVSFDERAHVLDADVALDDADREIAELPADADDESGEQQLARAEARKREANEPRQRHADEERADRAFPRLVRADVRPHFVAAEEPPERERRDVVQRHGEEEKAG